MENHVLELLKHLGADTKYKGCEYILFCVDFIHNLEAYTIPDTKLMYQNIADIFTLNPASVENSIRNVITHIWTEYKNPELMKKVFGFHNYEKRPCNIEFLILFYNHIKYHIIYEQRL